MQALRSVCPLNCPDSCTLLVETGNGEIKVKGDQNSITQGFICSKGLAYAKKAFSSDRIHYPLLKEKGRFKRISWDAAYEIVQVKIKEALERTGSNSILHLYDNAHNGVLRNLDRRFFESLGGCTEPSGSMCWGAGYEAQTLDFGAVYSSQYSDVINAHAVFLWGRDPALTNLHLVPDLMKARRNGTKVIVINPIRVKSCDFADKYIQVRPGSDAFLALGIAHIILKERTLDLSFIQNYVLGFENYAKLVGRISLQQVEDLTGVNMENIRELAQIITSNSPVTFFLGFGLQRYVNGADSIRAIDALAAITGNIGKRGAGVHYAHQYHKRKLNSLRLPEECYTKRLIPHAVLAEELKKSSTPIEIAFVTRSNPLIQQPDSALWREVWRTIPFKVTLDYVLSETARESDLVLPIATIFEEEEFIATSWSPLLQYVEPVIKVQGEAKPEPLIFIELAKRMNLKDFPFHTLREWIEYVIEPLQEYGITLDTLKGGPVLPKYIPEVAWEDKNFRTASGKIELLHILNSDSLNREPSDNKELEFPWHLITPHPRQSIHSQFMEDEFFRIWIHPELAKQRYLRDGDWAMVETETGQLKGRIIFSEDIHPETVVIPEGAVVDGLGVNTLIKGKLSVIGQNTAYYDIRCEIRKWFVD